MYKLDDIWNLNATFSVHLLFSILVSTVTKNKDIRGLMIINILRVIL